MKIESVEIKNFKAISSEKINIKGSNVYVLGKNGVGKSSFLDATVESRTMVDAQINYSVPSIKSVFKLGGSNLTGKEYFSAPGVGAVGSQYYLSWTINN